jgi:hypothetical protein
MAGHGEAAIAVRAYEIWETQGRPDGRDREHWLQAAAELAAIEERRTPKPSAKAPRPTATRAKKKS